MKGRSRDVFNDCDGHNEETNISLAFLQAFQDVLWAHGK